MSVTDVINKYTEEVKRKYYSGIASEHAYRPALQELIESLCEGINAVNDAKRVEVGAPDFILTEEKKNPLQLELVRSIPLAFVEAKDLKPGILDKAEHQKQIERYMDLGNVVHTDSLTFRFYFNRELVKEVSLGEVTAEGKIIVDSQGYEDLAHFFRQSVSRAGRTIRTAKILALHMADRARPIRSTILHSLQQDLEQGTETDLTVQYAAFQRILIHDLKIQDFADIYAETIAYGLFAARFNDNTTDDFSLAEAAQKVPQTNPFLRQFFLQIAAYEKDPRLDWVLNNFADLFSYADVKKIMSTYGVNTGKNHDPVTHFYETFLGEYDPKRRKIRGVYYTPLPVVKNIISAVDQALVAEFGLADGLADDTEVDHVFTTQPYRNKHGKKDRTTIDRKIQKVQILDPATGTSTFLNEIINDIFVKKGRRLGSGWSDYVENSLLKRIHGFEILMAAYAMAHMRLGLTLADTGYKPNAHSPRLGVYLTNSLDEPNEDDHSLLGLLGMGRTLTQESREADMIKRDLPIMVVVGNPPYSISSSNKNEFVENLITDYKRNLNERNIQALSDDYVKFIRYAEYMIEQTGTGIVAMITNNSYLDGINHRQMRKHLLETFDKIYVLDLHGNSKKKELSPDGSKDENVFDIMQGVSIAIMIKTGKKNKGDLAKVKFAELYGKREYKYERLLQEIEYNDLDPIAPYYLFSTTNDEHKEEFESGISLEKFFIVSGSGIKFRKDKLLVSKNFTKSDAEQMVNDVQSLDNDSLLQKYGFKETDDWRIDEQRQYFMNPELDDFIKIKYRPFDDRWTFYPVDKINKIIPRGDSRRNLMKHMIGHENLGLELVRQPRAANPLFFDCAFMVNGPVDMNMYRRGGPLLFPLYLYHDDGTRTTNFNIKEYKKLIDNLDNEPFPESIMDYFYAILYSPSYRSKFKEQLLKGFPFIPVPKNSEDFERLARVGKELRELHLLINVTPGDYPLNGEGDNIIEAVSYSNGDVYINRNQYFSNVPKNAWNFYIGGYQPAQRWLTERKGRALNYKDIEHYQRTITVLSETERLMEKLNIF